MVETNAGTEPSESPPPCPVELCDWQGQIARHFEEAIRVEYPAPDTCAGPAQRIRLETRDPHSILTVGAKGSATSEGEPIGPGGFGLYTAEHLGAQVLRDAYVTIAGVTSWTSGKASRHVTPADLGMVAQEGVRIGSTVGAIEITAGNVPVEDPGFTTRPPSSSFTLPTVDTASPRSSVSAAYAAVSGILDVVDAFTSARDLFDLAPVMARGASDEPGAVIRFCDALLGLAEAAFVAFGASAVETPDEGLPSGATTAPGTIHMHGTDGVTVSSQRSVGVFAPVQVSLSAGSSASMKAVRSVAIKSAGIASVKAGAGVNIGALGPVSVKSKMSTIAVEGEGTVLSGKRIVAVKGGQVSIKSDDKVAMNAGTIALGAAEEVVIKGERKFLAKSGRLARVEGSREAWLLAPEGRVAVSGKEAVLEADDEIRARVGNAKVEIRPEQVRVEARELVCTNMRVTRECFVFRGDVRLA